MIIARRDLLLGAALAPFALPVLRATAQDAYSSSTREIRVVCGYAAGTGADTVVRFFADRLKKYTNRAMVVENKPGAGASLAAEYVARSQPDGHTLFITPGNGFASNAYLYKKLPHSVVNDFAPVTTLVKLPFLLVVAPESPAKTYAEFLALMKEKGDKASYAYPNNVALAAGEFLKTRTGLKALAVPYKSTPEALHDMRGGRIDFIFSDATFGLGQVRAGNMRGLAVTTAQRSGLAPDIPTLKELGIADFHLEAWWGAWFPANTPQPVVAQMSKWLNEILADPETKEFFAKGAIAEPYPGTPDSTRARLKEDIPIWADVFRLAKVEPI